MQHFKRDVPSTSPHQRQIVFVTVSKTNDEDHIKHSFNPLWIDTLSYSTPFKDRLVLIVGFVAASVLLSLRGALYPVAFYSFPSTTCSSQALLFLVEDMS